MLTKLYCKSCGCEIKNVEDYLAESLPTLWRCRTCFFNIKTEVQLLTPVVDEDFDLGPEPGLVAEAA